MDSIWVDAWPQATDTLARNLDQGDDSLALGGIDRLQLRGTRVTSGALRGVGRAGKKPLPGSINIEFADGHAEGVKLEKLWALLWHKDYVPPTTRPN